MRTKNLGVLALCMLCIFFTMQARADKPKVSGYYIDMEGTRHEGMIEVPLKLMSKKVETTQQNSFTYYDKRSRKIKLDAATAKEFGCTYEGEQIVFRVLPKTVQKATLVIADFYRLMIDGPCSFYLLSSSASGSALEYCLFKDEEHFYVTITGMPNPFTYPKGRIKELTTFFEDCPALIEKMKKKEFTRGDERYWEMTNYYNSSCTGAATEPGATGE
jgi:hypothetical protein